MNTLKKYLLASFVLLSFACTKKDANTPSTEVKSKVLNVYSWSNYINPDLIADFEKVTGEERSKKYLPEALANEIQRKKKKLSK